MHYDERQFSYIDAEKSVIGGLLLVQDMTLESSQKVFSFLKTGSFASLQHQTLFDAIKRIGNSGNLVDALVLTQKLESEGKLDQVGGMAYMTDCMKISNVSNYVAHARIVREAAVSRTVKSKLANALALFDEPDGRSADQKLGEAISMMEALSSRAISNKQTGLVSFSDATEAWLDEVEERQAAQKEGRILGNTTGITKLDEMLSPKHIPDGSLVVIGARPKMGKTALLCSLAEHTALNIEKAVAMFSLEMMNGQIIERFVSSRSGVSSNLFYESGDDVEWSRAASAIGEFKDSKLFMDDTPGVTLEHVQRECRKLAKKEKLGMIAVDYLTLMSKDTGERNDLALSKITIGLKNLAKELNCVVVLLTQLNRDLEKRPDKRPFPSDSRDTGSIEQDCDMWLGLYRDDFYNSDTTVKGLTEILVRLNRHGDTGMVPVMLKNGNFTEWAGPLPISNDDDEY